MARPRYFREQILSGVQSEEHYKSRLQSIEADLKERQESLERQGGGEIPAPCSSSGSKEAPGGRRGPDFQYSGTDRRVLPGSGEWQERDYRASQYPCHYQKGKAQRFDTMMEQIDIRKAGISQRQLHLKTEEAQQQSELERGKGEVFSGNYHTYPGHECRVSAPG